MKCSSFRGRKNARRVNALAEKQQQIADTTIHLNRAIAAGKEDLEGKAYYEAKLQRLQKNADNIAAKVMEQGAAEAVRTKKSRQGTSRKY